MYRAQQINAAAFAAKLKPSTVKDKTGDLLASYYNDLLKHSIDTSNDEDEVDELKIVKFV